MNTVLPPGKYFIGDPCYGLSENDHHNLWGEEHRYENGRYDLRNNKRYFAVHNTHWGDGKFYDTKKRRYMIDSGMLSMIHIDLIEDIEKSKKKGNFFHFLEKINFLYNAGKFYIKSGKFVIEINTINEEEYESELEEHLYEKDKQINIRDDDDNSSFGALYDQSSDEEDEEKNVPKFKKFFKN